MFRHAPLFGLTVVLLLLAAPETRAEGVAWTVDLGGDVVDSAWTLSLAGGGRIAHERGEARAPEGLVRLSRPLPGPVERIEVSFVGGLSDAQRASSLALVLAGQDRALRVDHAHGGDVPAGESVVRVALPEVGPTDTPSATHVERFPPYLHEVVLAGRALSVTITDLRTGAVVARIGRADVGLAAGDVSLVAVEAAQRDGAGVTWLDDVHVDLLLDGSVAAVCGPDDPPTSNDCDGACDAIDLPGSPDCDGLCGPNDDFLGPDCDPQWYCNHNPGGPCDDGDPCTVDDSCRAGAQCVGDPRDCSGLNDQCNVGTCDEDGGFCKAVPIRINEACDDQNPCTVNDHCDTSGACASDPKDCSTFNDVCNAGTCNYLGVCETEPINAGGSCDDGNPCTTNDVCTTVGGCAGAPMDCSGLDEVCVKGYCDGGTCASQPINVGVACDDADPCTLQDVCGSDGVCGGAAIACGSLDDACHAGVCEGGTCVAVPANAGGSCDDGDPCTVGDVCDASGGCAGGPVNCSALDDVCRVGQCNANGACTSVPANAGGACDDGDPCTTGDACNAGTCVGAALDCSGYDGACHVGICDGAGGCVAVAAEAGGACDDLDPCTRGDVCGDDGTCAGTPDTCDQLDSACTAGMCDESGGCVAVPTHVGGGCDDGDPCTTGDVCGADGSCGGAAVDCSELDGACQVGVCDGAGACVASPANLGGACDDGDPCTTSDACDAAGACGGLAKDCSDLSDACHDGICEAGTGACVATPARVGGACTDGDVCTLGDACGEDGGCAGTPIDCTTSTSTLCNLTACNPARDLDGDGVIDTADADLEDPNVCADADEDGCDDCALTGADGSGGDVEGDGDDADGDGLCDVGDPDIDDDGLDNDAEADLGTDPFDDDTDGDGLSDAEEAAGSTSPIDADSDDDGLSDKVELTGGGRLASWGATDPNDPDTDGDGLLDGLEVGVTEPIPGHTSAGPEPVEADGTNLANGVFRADADPSTNTDPTSADTDGGTVSDGVEDVNRNGAVDPGERNPTNPTDDVPVVETPPGDGGGCAGGEGQGALASLGALLALAATRRRHRHAAR